MVGCPNGRIAEDLGKEAMCYFMSPAGHVFDYEIVVIIVSDSTKELNLQKEESDRRLTSSRAGLVACLVVCAQHPVLVGGH